MSNKIELRQVRSFSENVNEANAFIVQNWKPLIKVIATICGIFILGDVVMESFSKIQIANRYSQSSAYYTSLFLKIIFLLLAYLSVYLTSLCYITLYREKKGVIPGLDEVWAYFKYYFFRFFGSGILICIMMFIFMVICMIPFIFFASSISSSVRGGNTAAFVIIYCFCIVAFLTPLIYITPGLSLIFPAMIAENGSFSYSLKKGFKLVKNNWWPTFGVFFIAMGVVYVVNITILLPLTVIDQARLLVSTSNFYIPFSILLAILKGLVLFTNLLPAIAMSMSYYSLVERKEDVGLLERIDLLGQTDPADNPLTTEDY